ncbi:hypothetical protein TrST_g8715 [Triparma strigata]|uniref:Uncharacterized protein n=1 Tax=Triparma strigata TaxID=1606541 RepID=A0A9W6ZGN5_9STRA|nr:hypothetical protein TrST_g8715 [Triparma strigata]
MKISTAFLLAFLFGLALSTSVAAKGSKSKKSKGSKGSEGSMSSASMMSMRGKKGKKGKNTPKFDAVLSNVFCTTTSNTVTVTPTADSSAVAFVTSPNTEVFISQTLVDVAEVFNNSPPPQHCGRHRRRDGDHHRDGLHH